jgi:hypothetical protein
MKYMQELGATLINNGYKLVPVEIGEKRPCKRRWQEDPFTKGDVKKYADKGIGILCGDTVGLDLDILCNHVSLKMVQWAEKLLGTTVVRTGLAPKQMLVYRTDTPRKKRFSNTYEDYLGNKHQVEILGIGNQFVSYNEHESGVEYTWRDGRSLMNIKHAALPLITEQQITKLLEHFEQLAQSEGWECVREAHTTNGDTKPMTNGQIVNPDDAFAMMGTFPKDQLLVDLYSIDPDNPARQPWINIGMILNHEYGGSDIGLKVWKEWSQSKGGKYYEGDCDYQYRKFGDNTGGTLTGASLKGMASGDATAIIEKIKNERAGRELTFSQEHKIIAELAPTEWLVKDILPAGLTGIAYGESTSGKTFWAGDLWRCIGTGKDYHGHPVKKGPVFVLSGEGKAGRARRGAAWEMANDYKMGPEDKIFTSDMAAQLANEAGALAVIQAIEAQELPENPVLVVIDTLTSQSSELDENRAQDVAIFLDILNTYLRDKFGSTNLIIHHTGLTNKSRPRGSSSLYNNVDFVIRIQREDTEDHIVTVTNEKTKDGQTPSPMHFEMKEYTVGNPDTDDRFVDPLTSLAPRQIDRDQIIKGDLDLSKLSVQQRLAYDIIDANKGMTQVDIVNEMLRAKPKPADTANKCRGLITKLKRKTNCVWEHPKGSLTTVDPMKKVPAKVEFNDN